MIAWPDGERGRMMRFALVGCIVAFVYLFSTTFLSAVVGLPFQLALAIGYCLALAVHFTLQRVFVWAHTEGFVLPFHHQLGRYLLVTCVQYAITAGLTSLLPSLLGLPTEVVYLATVPLIALANFLVFGRLIFHSGARSAVPPSH